CEIFEVGGPGLAPLEAPPSSEKAWRDNPLREEELLGWRPAPHQHIGNTSWTLQRRIGEGSFGEVWLATHAVDGKRAFKFGLRRGPVRSLRGEKEYFDRLKHVLGNSPEFAED